MIKISLPFKITNVLQGFAETEGIMIFDGESLTLQFQTKDVFVGGIKSKVKNVKIAVSDIEEVDLKKSIFGNTLTIRILDMTGIKDIPRQHLGEVVLSIDRRNIELALDFVSSVRLEVADQKLRSMEY